MDKKQFDEKIGKPDRFSSQDRVWLKAMQAKYPHSSVVGLMALLADHAHGYDTEEQRREVALRLCDSGGLEAMLGRAKSVADDASFDILSEINTFQEVSFKTAPKSELLSQFLQGEPEEGIEPAVAEERASAGGDKRSLQADEGIVTETLAVILEKQGKYERALSIYRKLLARNPEKSSIFAPRIERLETIVNN